MAITIYLIITFLISVLASMVMMPWILHLCHKNGLYDTPSARKVHKNKIPRLGGAVFVPTTTIGLVLGLILLNNNSDLFESIHVSTLLIGLGLLIIYLIGLLDDLFGLSANLKFLVQLVSVMAFPLCGLYIENLYGLFGIYEINQWLAYPITVFLVMFIVNACNTIDGIDGLCSCLTVIALLVYNYFFMDIHNYIFCIFICALIGSLVVFAFYNMFGNVSKGTKTFMGDSGSLMLGFTLSYLGLKLSMPNSYIEPPLQGILIPFSVLMIPSFDLVRVAFARMMNGVHPFHPDKTHIHHLLMHNGMTQHTALMLIVSADIALIALNFMLWNCAVQITWIVAVDVTLYSLAVWLLYRLMPEHVLEEMKKTQHTN